MKKPYQVDMATHMLQQGQKLRRERKAFKELNEALFDLWAQHIDKILNSSQLSAKVAKLYTKFNGFRFTANAVNARSLIETQL